MDTQPSSSIVNHLESLKYAETQKKEQLEYAEKQKKEQLACEQMKDLASDDFNF